MTYQYFLKATNLLLFHYFVLYNRRSAQVHIDCDYVTLPRTQFYRIIINNICNALKLYLFTIRKKPQVATVKEVVRVYLFTVSTCAHVQSYDKVTEKKDRRLVFDEHVEL